MKILIIFIPAVILFVLSGCGSNNPVTNPQNNTDTAFVSYIIVTPTGGVSDTVHFTDRNLCTGSYSSSQNNTYCLLNDTNTHNSSSVTFNGNSTGTPAFTFGYISYNGNSLSANTITGAVTLYEAVGGKIKGTFSGSYSSGSTNYQCNGMFTVTRTQ